MLERAQAVMSKRGFDDFSEFISSLIREEFERRQSDHQLNDAPGPPLPPAATVTYPKASKTDIEGKILGTVKKRVAQAQKPRSQPK